MKAVEEIITDKQLDKVWGNANFGDVSKRSVILDALKSYACGFHTGHTAKCIVTELKLVNALQKLTEKGLEYLIAAVQPHPQVVEAGDIERMAEALRGIVQCCDGNNPDHEQIYHIANDALAGRKAASLPVPAAVGEDDIEKYENKKDWLEDKMYEIIDHLDVDSEGLIIGRTKAAEQCVQLALRYASTPPAAVEEGKETVGQLLTKAIKLHELNPDTVERELKLPTGHLAKLMNDEIYTNSVPVVLFKNLLLSLHIPYNKIVYAMIPTFKLLLSKETPETIKKKPHAYRLWENEQAVMNYTQRLEDLMAAPSSSITEGKEVSPVDTIEVVMPKGEHEILIVWMGYNQLSKGRIITLPEFAGYRSVVYLNDAPPVF